MAGPVLTPEEIAQLQKEKAKAESVAATFSSQIAAAQARAQELAKTDSAFKKFFDYYNSIIGSYDAERKALNGLYIVNPVTEADILDCANLVGGRIQPSLPATDITRIAEFDGGGTATQSANETQSIANQASVEDALKNGYGSGTYAATILTDTAITPTSTALTLKNAAATFSIAPGAVFVVSNGTALAVIKVVSFTMRTTPVPPPYTADLVIELVVAPTTTIPTGQTLTSFTGFTTGERATKTASQSKLQPLMNYLVQQLQGAINTRLTNLADQLTALASNQDPDGGTEITAATTNVTNSRTALQNYLSTTDISDAGLLVLSNERAARSSQITSRVSQITNAYTGRTENYYNRRYATANDRANTARGTLRMQKAAEQSGAQAASFAATLGDQADAFGRLISG